MWNTQLSGAARSSACSPQQAITLQQMTLDAATAEVVDALRAQGIRSVLLKGPAIAHWLYEDASQRPYADVDLLVAPDDVPLSEEVLGRLGYTNLFEGTRPGEVCDHETEWTRSVGPARVDLHHRLYWIGADPEVAWALLTADVETMDVEGARIEVLAPHARALMLALNALYHGARFERPLADLELAVTRLDDSVWHAAAELAARLGAAESLAAGLRLVPSGRVLAPRLGLTSSASVEVLLIVGGTPTAMGFESLREQPTTAARLRFLWKKLFPTPAFLRLWSPIAQRGPLGLLAVYLWRPLWLVAMAPRGLRAWRRARRVQTHM
jgi:putative nucleotidyltransferase-like protein